MLDTKIYTFLKVAELGSFSKAAEELFISNVSVMKHINNLENHLKLKLFERTHQGVSLTKAGNSLYNDLKPIQFSINEALIKAHTIEKQEKNTIRIGTSIMRPYNLLTDLWEKLSENSQFKFEIVSFNDNYNFDQFINNIDNTIDCFLTPFGSSEALNNYNFLLLKHCQCLITMSKKHPLARREILNWKDLNNQTLLLMKEGKSYILDELRKDILINHDSINIVDNESFYNLNTFNICEEQNYLMETLDIWKNLHPSLISIPVNWNYEIPYGIVYSNKPTKVMEMFIKEVEKIINLQKSK